MRKQARHIGLTWATGRGLVGRAAVGAPLEVPARLLILAACLACHPVLSASASTKPAAPEPAASAATPAVGRAVRVSSVASLPGPTQRWSKELIDGAPAHVLTVSRPDGSPDYQWQFLRPGVRMRIDRKDGKGWKELVSRIEAQPEYTRAVRSPSTAATSVWQAYVLELASDGADLLQGFDRQPQADGSVCLVRQFRTWEADVEEQFTETWTVPQGVETGAIPPKATFDMTRRRGPVVVDGLEEGAWRLRWSFRGVDGVERDAMSLVDAEGWPIRRKSYAAGALVIDVNDFDNVQNRPDAFTYSQWRTGGRVEILFFPQGTTGERLVDPATVTSNVVTGWRSFTQRLTHFDGTNFYVFYEKGASDANLYWKSSADGSSWGGEQTLSPTSRKDGQGWDIWWDTDTTGVLAYSTNEGATVGQGFMKLTISNGPAITPSGYEHFVHNITNDHIAVTMANNTIFSTKRFGINSVTVFNRSQTGLPDGTGTWTTGNNGNVENTAAAVDAVALVPYSTTKVLIVFSRDAGGTAGDGWYLDTYDGSAMGGRVTILAGATALTATDRGPSVVRISDTDFRIVLAATSTSAVGTLGEWKWNNSTVSLNATIDATNIAYKQPALMRESATGDLYLFAQDSGGTNTPIYRYKNTGGSSWGTRAQVDGSEGAARKMPVTQYHEPPPGSGRSTPRQLIWGYQVVNGSNVDLRVGTLELAAGSADLSWSTGAADFKVYRSSALTWDAGVLVCAGSLTDNNLSTTVCDPQGVRPSTQYRVQVVLKSIAGGGVSMSGGSEWVEHRNVKTGWAGAGPTLGGCAFNDLGADNGATTCTAAFNGNHVKITNTGGGNVVLAATSGQEGFMYLITTDASVPGYDSGGYLDASIDTFSEDSSVIAISGSRTKLDGGLRLDGIIIE